MYPSRAFPFLAVWRSCHPNHRSSSGGSVLCNRTQTAGSRAKGAGRCWGGRLAGGSPGMVALKVQTRSVWGACGPRGSLSSRSGGRALGQAGWSGERGPWATGNAAPLTHPKPRSQSQKNWRLRSPRRRGGLLEPLDLDTLFLYSQPGGDMLYAPGSSLLLPRAGRGAAAWPCLPAA